MTVAFVGCVAVFAFGGQPIGFGDVGAEEDAVGNVADEVVPAVAFDEGDVADAVASVAGEERVQGSGFRVQ